MPGFEPTHQCIITSHSSCIRKKLFFIYLKTAPMIIVRILLIWICIFLIIIELWQLEGVTVYFSSCQHWPADKVLQTHRQRANHHHTVGLTHLSFCFPINGTQLIKLANYESLPKHIYSGVVLGRGCQVVMLYISLSYNVFVISVWIEIVSSFFPQYILALLTLKFFSLKSFLWGSCSGKVFWMGVVGI